MLLYINDLVYTFIMLSYFDEFWAMKGMNCFFFFFFFFVFAAYVVSVHIIHYSTSQV